MERLLETVVGNYTIYLEEIDFLGRGTFGDVYKGIDNRTRELVAVKRVTLLHNADQEKYLERELAALSIIDHPNVVKLYDVERTYTFLYLFMEFCDGGDLDKYLLNHYLPSHTMISLIQQSADAVMFMHNIQPNPIIHRDLKPGNFLIKNQEGTIVLKVADFGFARHIPNEQSRIHGTACGSPDFMAPEVRPDRHGTVRYTFSADVFSLGIIYLAMVNHRPGAVLRAQKVEGLPVGQWMSDMQKENKVAWPPVDFTLADDAHVKDIKVLVTQMIRQEPRERLSISQVCQEITKINTRTFITATKVASLSIDETLQASTGFGKNNSIIFCFEGSSDIFLYQLDGDQFTLKWQKLLPRGQEAGCRKYIAGNGNIYLQTGGGDIEMYDNQLIQRETITADKMLVGLTEVGGFFASWFGRSPRQQKMSYETLDGESIHTFDDRYYDEGEYLRVSYDAAQGNTAMAGRNGKFLDIFDGNGKFQQRVTLHFKPDRPSCDSDYIFIPVYHAADIEVYTWGGLRVCTLNHSNLELPADAWLRRVTPVHNNVFSVVAKVTRGYILNAYHVNEVHGTTVTSAVLSEFQ